MSGHCPDMSGHLSAYKPPNLPPAESQMVSSSQVAYSCRYPRTQTPKFPVVLQIRHFLKSPSSMVSGHVRTLSGHVRTLRRSTKAIEIPTTPSRKFVWSSIMTLSQLFVLPDDKLWSVSVPRSQNACDSDFWVFRSIKFSILKISSHLWPKNRWKSMMPW